LKYDSLAALETFLNHDGNRALSKPIVQCDGILDPIGENSSVWCPLVGAGRFVQHYLGIRKKGANTAIKVQTSAGFNDGFMALFCCTPNYLGIGPRSPLVLDFGPHYDPTREPPCSMEGSPTKKFRGTLDMLLAKMTVKPNASEEADTPDTPGDGGFCILRTRHTCTT